MGDRKPEQTTSYLTDDTPERENMRREIEIAGLIKATGLASETRRDRTEQPKAGVEAGLDSGSPQHPILGDNPKYDGLDPEVNPLPDLTSPEGQEAYQLEQQLKMQKRMELQNRLQNQNDPSMKPKPG
jgi:hypothetical protein